MTETAAQGLFGNDFGVTMHGDLVDSPVAPLATATIHPSAILRARGDEDRDNRRSMMISDLVTVKDLLDQRKS
ncbi:MAG: hypothetical protein ACSLFD_11990 [Solirubrobacterales bacterium]